MNQRLGTDIKLTIKPIPDLIRQVNQKALGGILSIHPGHADKYGWLKTKPYMNSYPTVFTKKGFTFTGPSDLAGKKIAIIDKVFFSQKLVDLYGAGSSLVKVNNSREGLERVRNGTADLYIGSSRSSYLLSKYQFYELIASFQFYEHPTPNVMAVRNDWPQLVSILNKGLKSISAEEIESIRRKWGYDSYDSAKQQALNLTTEEQAWLKANPRIEVGVSPIPPYMFSENGKAKGYLIDMLERLVSQVGIAADYSIKPIEENLSRVKSGELHTILGMIHSEERAGLMYFSENVMKMQMSIFARTSRSDISDAASLADKVIASIKGYGFEPVIKKFFPNATIIQADDTEGMLRLVASGEADAAVQELHSGEYILRDSFINGVSRKGPFSLPGLPLMTGSEFGVSKKYPLLNSILNKAYDVLPESEKNRVWRKWFASDTEQKKTIKLTSEEQTWLADNHTVRVRGTDQAPYMFFRNGKAVGISADLIRIISEYTGINFHFVIPSPPFSADLQSLIQHTGPDLFGSLTPTQERKKNILFTEPYVSSPKFIFTRYDSVFVSSMTDLSGKTVALIKGYLIHEALAKNYPDIKLAFYKNNKDALKAVSEGKSFAFIGGLFSTPFMINKYGLKNLRACAPSTLPAATVAMAIRSDWPELRDIINKVFEAMPSDEKAAIVNKWSSVKIEYGIRPIDVLKWIFVVVGMASGIVLLFVFWNRTLQKNVKERTNALETSKKSLESEILERKKAEKKLLHLKDQLHEENIYLREEIQVEHNFNEIIGNSAALRYVLFRVEQIAATDTTALILGETGTGKELIAHAIHNTSSRKERPLIRVNCATLPAHLIESELFGHEKGAFTGATVQRIGRFELADGATLFLDEIGEMPLELQPKLLRVLQDGEFERVGSSRTIKVDVRLIAATNRDLETEIKAGRFRQDLFYRLNVYSLTLPPLRERPEDITLLVDTFIKKYNKKLGKHIELISNKTTDALMAYSWPGNIRELQNVIEHAVIVAQDKTLRVELPETQTLTSAQEPTQTLDEMERDYIQEVLTLKNWRIDGPEGAALVLDLKPSTLRSRMQKLGIKRPS